MDTMRLPHVAKAAILLTIVFVAYQAYVQLTVGRRRRALQREKGTLLAPWHFELRDRIMGLDDFLENIKALKEHRYLARGQARFENQGVRTMHTISLGRHVISTIEPENLKTIQAVDFKKWTLGSRRISAFRPFLGLGIFTTAGADWHRSREMLRPNFARSQVGDLATFETHVNHLIAAVPKDGSEVDLSELFFRLTMDSATEFLLGESTESLTKDSEDGFADAFTRSQAYVVNMARWGGWAKLFPANKQWMQDKKFVHDFVDYYVRKALARRNELLQEQSNAEKSAAARYVFIDELVRQTTDPIRIRSELLNVLLAGRDTTASLLTNAWFMLSKRDDVWNRLQAEVSTLHGEQPSFDQLKDMKYLKAFLNETQRLYPVVPVNSRQAVEDTTLPLGGGKDGLAPVFVPKGWTAAWSVWAMHRRKDYFGEDAEEFRPERWLDDPETGKKGLRPGWEFLPFNGGPRICLGQQFAINEASYTTVRLCQAFEKIESRDPGPWVEALTLTAVNLNGAKVVLTARDARTN
ncbi:hypothetical protein LTR91_012940 [Friedmanniomyces endolithicus]|uniref:Cytochrome P450 52A13 n=1 Tax=Friedmanniomyces endolithicus TaxID=329885 RepID=A0AAN6QQ95_9PEZI|nr:hypothetical protein LTR94_003988 [Friedmanniomyces endolithicus]KAK0776315.1 hypothetical protein LTR59_014235 [Friedmanniomyces endolithicus]KAK0786126.1 hypothetical protein LTR75_013301 [Friedmanniomyces endolithicus]KAK0799326.1 hypothetical protein LTR38_007512 [Friedmanniomyces endolithicus]KAK0842599.1 hypothetical protein LTR03_009215 [Friedmanniomyces endolithicus]